MHNIILIGPPRSGKSTLGPALARHFQLPWRDSDALITAETGQSPAQLLQHHGEERFRAIERAWLQSWHPATPTVLSTGGGLPCQGHNLQILQSKGLTLSLTWPTEIILKRLQNPPHALTRLYTPEALRERLEAREAIYQQAQLRVELVPEMSEQDALDAITRTLSAYFETQSF